MCTVVLTICDHFTESTCTTTAVDLHYGYSCSIYTPHIDHLKGQTKLLVDDDISIGVVAIEVWADLLVVALVLMFIIFEESIGEERVES